MFLKSKFFRAALALGLVLCCGASAILADTIRLKDGSVIKGKIVGFRDGQFLVSIGDGARARQMTFFADEVEAVEFDASSSAAAAAAAANAAPGPVKQPNPNNPTNGAPSLNNAVSGANRNADSQNQNSNVLIVGAGNGSGSSGVNKNNSVAAPNTNGVTSSPPSNTIINVGDPNTTTGANSVVTTSNTNPATTTTSGGTTAPAGANTNAAPNVSRPKPIQLNVKVLADNTANGWTNAGWHAKKGQRFRVTARGQISLGGGNFTKPEGIRSLADDKKLLAGEATGGLIAVIGDDNNDFIFIGAAREFIAQRDGMLFFGVNENNLNDNSGAFDVTIEIEPSNN